jgi:deoxyinosine 3'endonuclease (endonuclease V)
MVDIPSQPGDEGDDSIHQRRLAWTKEQDAVALKVKILKTDTYIECSVDLDERFCRLRPRIASSTAKYKYPMLFGGLDISYDTNDDKTTTVIAVYVVLDERLKIVYQDVDYCDEIQHVPYIPSFLAFRESPPMERLVAKQRALYPQYTPNVLFVDGNGVFHARRAGLACFVGVNTGLPTIGVAKNLYHLDGLTNEKVKQAIDRSLGDACKSLDGASVNPSMAESLCRGTFSSDESVLFDNLLNFDADASFADCNSQTFTSRKEKIHKLAPHCIGVAVPLLSDSLEKQLASGGHRESIAFALVGHGGNVLLTKQKQRTTTGASNPIFISVGHVMSLKDAVMLSALVSNHRVPEPIRQADLIGRDILRRCKLESTS